MKFSLPSINRLLRLNEFPRTESNFQTKNMLAFLNHEKVAFPQQSTFVIIDATKTVFEVLKTSWKPQTRRRDTTEIYHSLLTVLHLTGQAMF